MSTCTLSSTGLGCVSLTNCNLYTTENQCVINTTGGICGWNGSSCNDKSCSTAP